MNSTFPQQNASAPWSQTTWNGESAWQASHHEYTAIVSEEHARLVYFGLSDLSRNLIATPKERSQITEKDPAPDQGGHRFWIGPQKRWRWPPPREWEYSPAASCVPDGPSLTVKMQRLNADYPPIVRTYRWVVGKLECQAVWQSNGLPCYAMHVVAIAPIDKIDLRIHPSDTSEYGYLKITQDGPRSEKLDIVSSPTPEGLASISSLAPKGAKVGFPIQTINVPQGEYTLHMEHGHYQGEIAEQVDHGYLSQMWVRSPHPFNEIEQISPYLTAPEGEWIGQSIYLSITK